ncbi:EamA family transporter [Aureimonas fodinaquatilis]|uniref:EamA family transporter n=1 Tax=Aureimonas fodinaquatilis TaxID=2565783 RepID=A0A5B0DX15_9HYPH|nr:EamA family transporter [Aureimonas fodinaquatilis]KAA0970405.1 EamA family transporter [Aureimonas fodinaquatilis]
MKTRHVDLLLTAIAPAIWGSTYIVTSELLPAGYPITNAMLRALPAGFLLLALSRQLPPSVQWWWRVFLLGGLNFSVFWIFLFISAYRLPGGVAATLGAVQPLVVIFLAYGLLGHRIRALSLLGAISGLFGVALVVLGPEAKVDLLGVAAGLFASASMALGVVLSRRWQPPVSALTFTAWQLTAAGLLLVPVAFLLEPPLPTLTFANISGLVWLSIFGAAFTTYFWFRGLSRLEPSLVSTLGFLSPVTAVVLGWVFLGEKLTLLQYAGAGLVMLGIWLAQRVHPNPPPPPSGGVTQTLPVRPDAS